ncbi:MAG: DNA cytosine methyltransferase, partial [Mycobacterium sp.]
MTAPTYRSRCQLTGNPGESCGHADELATIGESIAQAVGFYDCPCGAEFELDSFDGIEAYAALNRWLGVHFGSGCMAETRVRELDAVCKAQAAEIRSLKTQRAQSWRVTGAVEVTMTLTLVSLFDGIGGFPLAFERAGAETVATVEIDDAAAKISHRHFPHAHQFTDVTKVTGDDLRTVGFVPERGIITAGWPCQDLSVAGRREGLAGARSGLWWHVVRLLAE